MIGKHAILRVGAVGVALGVLTGAGLTGCTGPINPGGGPTPDVSSSSIWPTPVTSSPLVSPSPSLSEDHLYQMAVSQYRGLFDELIDIVAVGGAPRLPEPFSTYLMDPAWSAVNTFYSTMYERGDRYATVLDYQLTAISWLLSDTPPDGTITALQTCELSQGAALVTASGEVLHDESPVIMHRRAYFKFDAVDKKLKVFVLQGEAVDSCPIQ